MSTVNDDFYVKPKLIANDVAVDGLRCIDNEGRGCRITSTLPFESDTVEVIYNGSDDPVLVHCRKLRTAR